MREKYEDDFKAGMGAEAIKELLQELDLEVTLRRAASRAQERRPVRRSVRIIKRLEVVEAIPSVRTTSPSG